MVSTPHSDCGLPVADAGSASAPVRDRLLAVLRQQDADLAVLDDDGYPDRDLMPVRVLREDLWAHGYRPVAVVNWNATWCSSPGKAAVDDGWQEGARLDPPAAVSDIRRQALTTGLLCDDLRAVDIDVDDAVLAAGVRRAAEEALGEGALVRFRDDSPRVLLVYRAAVPGQPKRKIKRRVTGYAVEVLGRGQQVVGFGRHASGARLRWEQGRSPDVVALADLPAVAEDRITLFLEAAGRLLGIEEEQAAPASLPAPMPTDPTPVVRDEIDVPVTIEDVRAALAVISDDGGDYQMWLRVGGAIHSVDAGRDGLLAFLDWSSRSPEYDRDAVVGQWRKYDSNPLTRVTAGSLIHMARAQDPSFVTPSFRAWLEARETRPEAPDVPRPTAAGRRKYAMYGIGEVLRRPPPAWLVPGLLAADTVAAIYGPPESFKSFAALHLAMSLAYGREWQGHRLAPSGVAYLGAEGGGGLGTRLAAWMCHHGVREEPAGGTVIEGVPNLFDPDDVAALIEGLEERAVETGVPTKLVVLDTLARCSVGIEENSSREMGLVVDALIRIRAALGATVLVVHHTGKDTGRGMRGSNRLLGDLDTVIEVVRGGDRSIALHTRKQKDAEAGDPLHFEMWQVPLPALPNGSPRSSLVPVAAKPAGAVRASVADARSIAAAASVGEVVTVSGLITRLGWKRGQRSYDRIRAAVPPGEGVVVGTDHGLRRVARVEGAKRESVTVSEVA